MGIKKLTHTRLYVALLGLLAVLVPVSATYAQTSVVTEAKCTIAKKRLAARIATITSTQNERTTKYTSAQTQIDTFITTATSDKYKGINELTTARDTVKKAIETYTAQATTYKTALEKAQSANCSEASGEFIAAITTARKELATLRIDSLTVKATIKSAAVPALRDYATWIKESAVDTQEKE